MSVFLDSNVVLYALGDDDSKREIARGLLASQPYLSTQVVNECSHVLRRKQRLAPDEIARHMESILELARLVEVGMAEIRRAWQIAARYRYSHYDSLILGTALSAGCSVLYSEDLQDGQVVEGQTTIMNPFRAEAGP